MPARDRTGSGTLGGDQWDLALALHHRDLELATHRTHVLLEDIDGDVPRLLDRSDSLLAHRADPFRMIGTTDVAQVESSRRDDVRVRVLQVQSSLAMEESMHAYEHGDAKVARAKLAAQSEQIREIAVKTKSAALEAEAKNIDDVMSAVAAAPAPASDKGQDVIKSQKARAFELRR